MAGFTKFGNKAKKYMVFQGVPALEGEFSTKIIGKGRIVPKYSDSYYQRASDKLGVTVEQAKKASKAGGYGNGKDRDKALRYYQDLNDGGNRASQYAQNRALAKKTTAGFAQKAKLKAAVHQEKSAAIKNKENQFNNGNVMFQNDKAIKPTSAQGQIIADILAKQKATQEVNAEQKKLFAAITGATNATEANKIRSAAIAQNPNVGTYNAVVDGTGKIKEESGVLGIGDGTIKDLNYNKFDRATQTFAENKKLGNLTDSQGNIVASNLKSSEGVEWNFSPVSTPVKEPIQEKTVKGIPVPPTAAGFLGGLSIFSQAPNTSSNAASTQTAAAVPTYEISLANYNADSAAFDSFWKANPPATDAQYDQYVAEFDALNLQYENLSDEFEAREEEYDEWGDYMKPDEKAWGFLPTPDTDNPEYNALIKSGSNTFSGITNIGIYLGELTDPVFGTTTPKELYKDYYSTPVTNVESAVFGAGIGTATQGGTYWTSGQGTKAFDSELQQVGKNFERNPREATESTILESALYVPLAPIRLGYSFFKGLGKGAASGAGAKGAAKGFVKAPTAPKKPKFTAQEIVQAKKDWSLLQQGKITPSPAAKADMIVKLKNAKNTPNIPTTLKAFDDAVSGKISKVPKVDLPTTFKKIPSILDDLPVKAPKAKLPVRPKDVPTSIKVPDAIGFPKIPDNTPRIADPIATSPKGGKPFPFPFGWPRFGGRSGGAGTGSKGKRQGRKRFTAWDTRTDKIGFYGFGRKSDGYGGVFSELDALDKAVKAEKKTKSKKGFDDTFNFSFDF